MPRRPQAPTLPEAPPALAARTWVTGSPALSLATVLAVALVFPTLWPASVRAHLAAGVGLELVAIHSFLFFLVPVVLRPKAWWGHVIRWGAVAVLVGFYVGIALQASGGKAILADLLLMLAVTYGGPLLKLPDDNRLATAMVRWLYCFLSYAVAAGIGISIFGDSERGLFALGALYFAALGLLDSLNGFERFVLWRQQRVRRGR